MLDIINVNAEFEIAFSINMGNISQYTLFSHEVSKKK
jgi:hypothetical protein